MPKQSLMSAADVARYMGLTPPRIRQLILSGKLTPRMRVGQMYLFDRSTVEAFKKIPRPKGRPKKNP